MSTVGGILVYLLLLGAVPAAAATPAPVSAPVEERQYHVVIRAASFDEALRSLAEQTGLQIARFSDLPVNVPHVGPIVGTYTRRQVLDRLVAGTGFTYRFVDSNTVAIIVAAANDAQSVNSESPLIVRDSSQDVDTVAVSANKSSKAEGGAVKKTGLLAAIIATLVGGAAVAGDPAASSSDAPRATGAVLEEVIVTAKQREQSVHDVPLSITAFSSGDIAKLGIGSVMDVAQYTPNLVFYSGTGRQDPTALVIRGLAPNTSDERYQGLSVFVDGVYVSGQLASIDLSQLQRVEVLRGPQSATFGRATYSGAIDYVTRTPTNAAFGGRFTGKLSGQHGGENYDVNLVLDMPLMQERAWLSINGMLLRHGSVAKNPADLGPIGLEKTESFGAVLFVRPTDQSSIKLRFAYDHDEDSFSVVHAMEPAEWEAAGTPSIIVPGGFKYPAGEVPSPSIDRAGGGEFLQPGIPSEGGRNRDRYFVSLIAETQVFGNHELSYRGGFFSEKYWSNDDVWRRSGINDPFFGNTTNPKQRVLAGTASAADRALVANFNAYSIEEFRNQSHQIRLVSPGNERLRYKAGLYYFKEYDLNFSPNRATASNPYGQQRGDEYLENYALFGGVDYDLGTSVIASLEARVERERVVFEECTVCLTSNPGGEKVDERTSTSPRATLQYRFSEAQNLYALWARGYKAARHNTASLALPTAAPERLDNFEIGSKNRLLGGRATLNLAAFYSLVDNQQASLPQNNPAPPPLTLNGVGNFGSSRIYGFEVDGSVLIGERFQLSGGVGFADHEFTDAASPLNDFGLFAPGETVKGKTSLNTPRWTGTVSGEYTLPLQLPGYSVSVRGDYSWRSKMYIDRANIAYIGDAGLFNGRVVLAAESWSVALFAKNLFDDRTARGGPLSGTVNCLYTATPGARCIFLAPPRGREIGAEVRYEF